MPKVLTAPTPAQVAAALESWNSVRPLEVSSGSSPVTHELTDAPHPVETPSGSCGTTLDGWDGVLALTPAAAPIRQALESRLSDPASVSLLPDEPCAIMQTSGSSGQGKLVVLPRSTLAYSARATNEALGGPGNWACALPTHHIAGFQTVARPLLTGHKLFDAGKGTPEEIAECAASLRDRTYLSLVPTQLQRLLDSPQVTSARAFAAILVGGASTSPELLARGRKIGLNLVTTYGMTETCGGCAYNGRPIGDTRIAAGPHGRLTITGSVVAHGYLGSAPFSNVFPTNDSGTVAADGAVQVTGRLDRAISTGGLTVLPEPIERELERLGSGEAVVVGIPDPYWGEKLVAVTENPLNSPRVALKPIVEAAPQEFVTVAELGLKSMPRLDSGKPDRIGLARLLSGRAEAHRSTE